MIFAIIVIALLSLLVATEPEAADSSALAATAPPLCPRQKKAPEKPARPDRLAA
jgi:hypothetical protein